MKKKRIKITPILIICLLYFIGVILKSGIISLSSVENGIYQGWLTLDFYKINQGEWWRLFSFVVNPPGLTSMWSILAIIYTYIIGRDIECLIGNRKVLYYYLLSVFVQLAIAFVFFHLEKRVVWLDLFFWGWTLFPVLAFFAPGSRVYLLTPFSIRIEWLIVIPGMFLLVRFLLGNYTIKISLIGQIVSCVLFLIISYPWRKRCGKRTNTLE